MLPETGLERGTEHDERNDERDAVVIGYFVLFSATRSAGSIRRFGQVLAAWMFLLAGVVVLGGLVAPMTGFRSPVMDMTEHMQRMEQQNEDILRELQEE